MLGTDMGVKPKAIVCGHRGLAVPHCGPEASGNSVALDSTLRKRDGRVAKY